MLKRERGSIVKNASINGIRENHRLVAYSAKGRRCGDDHSDGPGLRASRHPLVNCVCPAAIENTQMDPIAAERAHDPEQRREYLLAKHPIGRLGQPEDVANTVLFLGERRIVVHHRNRASRRWRQIETLNSGPEPAPDRRSYSRCVIRCGPGTRSKSEY
jgi:hypothetical protein